MCYYAVPFAFFDSCCRKHLRTSSIKSVFETDEEEPATEEQCAEETVTEESVIEEPVAEEPVAEEPESFEPSEDVSYKDVTGNDVSDEDVSENDVSGDDIFTEDVSSGDISEETLSREDLIIAEEVGELPKEETLPDAEITASSEAEEVTYVEKEVRTTYCYDRQGKNLLMTVNESGIIEKYVYGNGLISSGISVTVTRNTTLPVFGTGSSGTGKSGTNSVNLEYKVYSYDIRGSVTRVSDKKGVTTAEYTYSTYGNRISEEPYDYFILGYCARDGVLTEANGLLYMRARYYSPDLMRFINEDIVTGDISNSNSLNRYSYVEGNPVAMVDPFGLEAERISWQDCKDWLKKSGTDAWNWIKDQAQKFDNWVGENSTAIMIITDVGLFVADVCTGGALTPVLVATYTSQLAGGAIGAGESALTYYFNNGTLEGASGYIMHGASKGGAYGCMGGLFFGAGYEAVNIYNGAKTFALAGESLSKFAQKAAAVTGTINEVGKKGEAFVSEALGLPHNNEIINMYGRDRIPDFIDESSKLIAESKNVANLSYTQQIKDYVMYAEDFLKTKLTLYVRHSTILSKPLQKAIKAGKIILEYFDW